MGLFGGLRSLQITGAYSRESLTSLYGQSLTNGKLPSHSVSPKTVKSIPKMRSGYDWPIPKIQQAPPEVAETLAPSPAMTRGEDRGVARSLSAQGPQQGTCVTRAETAHCHLLLRTRRAYSDNPPREQQAHFQQLPHGSDRRGRSFGSGLSCETPKHDHSR